MASGIDALERSDRAPFIESGIEKIRTIHAYFRALIDDTDTPIVRCNAPWVSTVVEADGTVRPCFFHPPLGNIYEKPLEAILNSKEAIRFRKQLDVSSDPICQRCVCSLNMSPTAKV